MNPAALTGRTAYLYSRPSITDPEAEHRSLRDLATAYPNNHRDPRAPMRSTACAVLSGLAAATSYGAAATSLLTGFLGIEIGQPRQGQTPVAMKPPWLKTLEARPAASPPAFCCAPPCWGCFRKGTVALLQVFGRLGRQPLCDRHTSFAVVWALGTVIITGGALASILASLGFGDQCLERQTRTGACAPANKMDPIDQREIDNDADEPDAARPPARRC